MKLENHVFEWTIPSFHSFAMEFPVFSGLDKNDIESLVRSTYEKRY